MSAYGATFVLLIAALGAVQCQEHAAAPESQPEPDAEDVISETFTYRAGRSRFEGTWLGGYSPEERPLVLIVSEPFGENAETESELAMELVREDYSVAMIELGIFRNRRAFEDSLSEDPEALFSHVIAAVDVLKENPMFFATEIALMGHGLAATLALEIARFNAADVVGVVAISPTSLNVSSNQAFTYEGTIALYVGDGGAVKSADIFAFEAELRQLNASYEVTRFSDAGDSILENTRAWQRTLTLLKNFLSVVFFPNRLEYLSQPFNVTNIVNRRLEFDYVDYTAGEDALRGFIAYPSHAVNSDGLPLVIIVSDWDGISDYEIWRAKLVAQMGYIAFVADIYGTDIEQGPSLPIAERQQLVGNFFGTPFVERLNAAIEAAVAWEMVEVEATKIAMMGYCFGGSGVLESAVAEVPGLKGVVSFHPGSLIPETPVNAACIPVAVLVLNGADDPSNSNEQLDEFFAFGNEEELTWEFTNYGGAKHAFTVPMLPRDGNFIAYNPFADVLSFASFEDFLGKIFADESLYAKCGIN